MLSSAFHSPTSDCGGVFARRGGSLYETKGRPSGGALSAVKFCTPRNLTVRLETFMRLIRLVNLTSTWRVESPFSYQLLSKNLFANSLRWSAVPETRDAVERWAKHVLKITTELPADPDRGCLLRRCR